MKKKYIFVCQHNFTRSRFGAEFMRGYLKGLGRKATVISRGVGVSSAFLGRRISRKDLNGVTCVFVMEEYMKKDIVDKFDFDSKKVVVLNIPDDYAFFKKKKIVELDRIFQKMEWEKYL
ncbi:MAG: hypothetical protein PF542_02625 [Nanoarchaeota archaeon]|jgi:predicted protein tyrosine phosphatase|nr:hypothetical protein [Nanoarchaeota archaeon]